MPVSFPSPIIRPRRLMPGDTLGIAAPAGPFDVSLFKRGVQVLRDMGFALKIPEGIFQRDGFLAGADPDRAAIINSLFADPEVHGIICARGGYGSTRVAPFLDWEIIRTNPKIFVGFSDITVLHHLINARCGLTTFHGPMVTTIGNAPKITCQAFRDILTSPASITIAAGAGKVIRPGEGAGIVAGGNLAMICHLLGTPLQPDFAGRLLFLEEVNEAPYRIDRMLRQMQLAGCFDAVAGVVMGDFVDCGEPQIIAETIAAVFENCPFPVLSGFPIGHGRVNHTLPLGVEAVLTSNPPVLRFTMAATI
jgi:muramoyltetrapeptide carboxypeptidase